jgi:hypothetical protein
MAADIESIILAKLETLERKIDAIMREGCSKADSHRGVVENQREIFQRLGAAERAAAEGKGRLAVAAIIAGAALSMFLQWVGRNV